MKKKKGGEGAGENLRAEILLRFKTAMLNFKKNSL
jgi:hypothetical protein